MYGRQVFMGYYHDEERTERTIDVNGWLRTGDIGRIDNDGYLYLQGRVVGTVINVRFRCKLDSRCILTSNYT